MRAIAVLSILFLFTCPGMSWSQAIGGRAASITADRAWNPWPEPDDLILPMPCNGQLVMRAVAVPIKTGLLDDQQFYMGIYKIANPERDIYERRFEGTVSAPFTLRDLPEAWRKALERQPDADKFLYYFMGKHEISTWQWRLVMEDSCPVGNPATADLRPKTSVSWYDMQQFLVKYMQWLVQNHKTYLPIFADNNKDIGFLRLPTEEEWEFAARGGISVPEEHRNYEDFHPLKEYTGPQKGNDLAELKMGDFAVYQAGDRVYKEAEPIGSRKPNPLLIYDMAGNAAELVHSTFRFSIAEQQGNTVARRLHGSAGGLITKGGSFFAGEESILPGARDEVPLFRESGVISKRDLGFRPVLSGINIPESRYEDLLIESKNPPKVKETHLQKEEPAHVRKEEAHVRIDPSGTLLSELDKVIENASSSTVRDNLTQYRSMVADNLSAADRQRGEVTMGVVRFALFDAEAITNLAYRIRKTERDYQDMIATGEKLPRQQIDEYNTFMNGLKDIFVSSINKYKLDLEALSKEPPDALNKHFSVIRKEYAGGGLLNEHMRKNLDALEKHLALVRQKGIGSFSKRQLAQDIVPAILMPTFDF